MIAHLLATLDCVRVEWYSYTKEGCFRKVLPPASHVPRRVIFSKSCKIRSIRRRLRDNTLQSLLSIGFTLVDPSSSKRSTYISSNLPTHRATKCLRSRLPSLLEPPILPVRLRPQRLLPEGGSPTAMLSMVYGMHRQQGDSISAHCDAILSLECYPFLPRPSYGDE